MRLVEKWEAAALPPTNLSALDALVVDFIKEEALCEARLLRLSTAVYEAGARLSGCGVNALLL